MSIMHPVKCLCSGNAQVTQYPSTNEQFVNIMQNGEVEPVIMQLGA